jgi:uncharacterized protein
MRIMKKITGISLLLLSVLLVTACSGNRDRTGNRETPAQQGPVNDFAGVLSGPEKEDLAAQLTAYEKETCHQIVVVIVQDLAGETIADFSTRTAQAWEIGQEFLDNGILVTIAVQQGSARIEAGSGLEWIVKERIADTILSQVMFPHFRQGRLADGLRLGVTALMNEARQRTYPPDHRPSVCL